MQYWIACAIVVIGCGGGPRHGAGDDDQTDATTCTAGANRCDGNTYEVCDPTGWQVVEQCPMFCTPNGCSNCQGPDCMSDACSQAGMDQDNLGCEYWAVDLDNATEILGLPIPIAGSECSLWMNSKQLMGIKVCLDATGSEVAGACNEPDDSCPTDYTCGLAPNGICGLDGDHAPFAVVVSNPEAVMVAVTIADAAGQTMTVTVDPGTIKAIYPQDLGLDDQSLQGTLLGPRAYKLTSTLPVVAYQFNPLNNVDVFSNDASLLIPRANYGAHYVGVTYPTLTRRGPTVAGRDDYHGYLTIVAWDDATTITVTPTANTLAGRDGTPALLTGQPHTFMLNAFDVLNLEAVAGPDPNTNNGLNGGDLTGTVIQSTDPNKTFGVFGGHEAVVIDAPGASCCADHLEEMLFPTVTWGKQFAVARTTPRLDAPDILRVVADTANTEVTFNPVPPDAANCGVLQASQYCDVHFTAPTTVTATQPITLAHLMMSAIEPGPNGFIGTGDPSLGIVPPVEQFRTDYKFLVPMDYDSQYVNIVAVQGDLVTIDGMAVTDWTLFGAGREAATETLTVGPHEVQCPAGCGVEIYGWSVAVSYLFAGGLNLHTIVIE